MLTSNTSTGMTTAYTYDNNGNTLTQKAGTAAADTYTYDLLNRMVTSSVGGVSATYKYRPDGLRFSKTSGGAETVHIWDGANIAGDVVGGVVGTTYVRGINLIASKSGSVFTYYLYNAHSDVVQLANASGTVTKSYDYDAFGVEKSPVTTDANPFRYCGEYFDKETNTVYLRARYYSPKLGRFSQQDVWEYMNPNDPLSLNLYIYCGNNPIRFFDPSGHKPWDRFDDPDDAAYDFAMEYGLTSIVEDLEYYSVIFAVVVFGAKTVGHYL